MSALAAVGSGLQAAFRLARGRADGVGLVESDRSVVGRSLLAIALCLPGELFLMLSDLTTKAEWQAALVPGVLGTRLLTFVVGWLIFMVLSHDIVSATGRGLLWPRYIALWNWCQVAQYAVAVLAAATALLHAPPMVAETAWLVTVGWSLWLEWFVARHALGARPLFATALVVLDLLINQMLLGMGIS